MAHDKYYKALGLRPGITDKGELKKTYKRLAIQHHPDRGGSEEKFKQVCEAYEILIGKRQPSRHELREQAQESQRTQQRAQRPNWQPSYQPPTRHKPPPPQPRREPRRVEYSYDIHTKCKSCDGQGQFVSYCILCDGTGNIVGLNDSGTVCVVRCLKCRHGVRKTLYCETCDGAGKVYDRTQKGYYYS